MLPSHFIPHEEAKSWPLPNAVPSGLTPPYAKEDESTEQVTEKMINGKKCESWLPGGSKGFETGRKQKPVDREKTEPARQHGAGKPLGLSVAELPFHLLASHPCPSGLPL